MLIGIAQHIAYKAHLELGEALIMMIVFFQCSVNRTRMMNSLEQGSDLKKNNTDLNLHNGTQKRKGFEIQFVLELFLYL